MAAPSRTKRTYNMSTIFSETHVLNLQISWIYIYIKYCCMYILVYTSWYMYIYCNPLVVCWCRVSILLYTRHGIRKVYANIVHTYWWVGSIRKCYILFALMGRNLHLYGSTKKQQTFYISYNAYVRARMSICITIYMEHWENQTKYGK